MLCTLHKVSDDQHYTSCMKLTQRYVWKSILSTGTVDQKISEAELFMGYKIFLLSIITTPCCIFVMQTMKKLAKSNIDPTQYDQGLLEPLKGMQRT